MPFQKGNKLWKEGIKIKQDKQDKLNEFLIVLANGGSAKYGDLMDRLAQGKDLTAAQEQFMDRFEGWREYVKPKLARIETKIEGEVKVVTGFTMKPKPKKDEK